MTLPSAERMSQCSGPRETGHVQCSMLYALEPCILNLSLALTCYLVVYAISALLSYNKILEITLSVLGILLSGSFYRDLCLYLQALCGLSASKRALVKKILSVSVTVLITQLGKLCRLFCIITYP